MAKIKLSNGQSLKCPICGNEEFVKGEFGYSDDFGWHHSADKFTCFECGYSILIDDVFLEEKINANLNFSPLFKELDEAIDKISNNNGKYHQLNESIKSIDKQIAAFEKEQSDPNRTVKRDEEIKAELKALNRDKKDKEYQIKCLLLDVFEIKERIEHDIKEHTFRELKEHYREELAKHLKRIEDICK